jgi:hypothetical protein
MRAGSNMSNAGSSLLHEPVGRRPMLDQPGRADALHDEIWSPRNVRLAFSSKIE